MRTIEKNILSTLSSGRAGVYQLSMRDRVEIENILLTLSSGRTGVYQLSMRDRVEINDDEKRVYLWNQLIYSINKKDNTVMFSLCGWNSVTTRSRLNALLGYHFGAGITQKNYNLSFVVNGKKTAIDSNSIYCLNDNADIVKIVKM